MDDAPRHGSVTRMGGALTTDGGNSFFGKKKRRMGRRAPEHRKREEFEKDARDKGNNRK